MVFQKSEQFLTMVIVLFFLLTLSFLILLTISRITKIKRLKKKNEYDSLAGNLMLSILFEEASYHSLINEKNYKSVIHDKFFRACLLGTVIKLHKSYTGEFAKKTETFYHESLLVNDTYKKLKHGHWSVKCEAVRELAEMNVTSSYALITKYVSSSNLTLRQEAITAIIKLIGLKGLTFLNDYKEFLTDWIQLNLIEIISNNFPTTDEPYYNSFINSPNKSVALFGKRLKLFYEHTGDSFIEENNLEEVDYHSRNNDNPILSAFKKVKNKIRQRAAFAFSTAFNRINVLSISLLICFFTVHVFEIYSAKISLNFKVVYFAFLNDFYITS